MVLDREVCYTALKARDTRFDGRFFVGVSSTGIYCRPICSARVPKNDNCTFYASAAAAEAAGYRPCLKCRPELAPGLAPVDASARLACKAALLIEEGCLDELCMSGLAATLKITDRHLRRVFLAEFGVPPLQYLQNRRLLLAKSLLTDTALSVTEVAFAAGFGSIRRFNDLFRKVYRLAPSALRKNSDGSSVADGMITLLLGYRPPYDWESLLAFLGVRALAGVENVSDGVYSRTVRLVNGGKTYQGWLRIANLSKKNSLAITVATTLLPVLPQVLARVRSMFDLNCNPGEVYEKLAALERNKPGMCLPGRRLPGCFSPFEMAVCAVLGQQLSIKTMRTLAMRLVQHYGEKIETPFADLAYNFPLPESIATLTGKKENLRQIGLTQVKTNSLYLLANALLKGEIDLSTTADPEKEILGLKKLPGFGAWTAEYIAMRTLGWPDAFLPTDLGVRKAFSNLTLKEVLLLAEEWRPWRSYAIVNIWCSLA